MTKGTTHWEDRNTFSVQTNNAIETILSKKLPKDSRDIPIGWLEDCGPTAAINVLESMGKVVSVRTFGGWFPQSEDVLALWFSDPRNYKEQRTARPGLNPVDVLGNEVPQYYPAAIRSVFGETAMYVEGQSFDWIASMVYSGVGFMICLKDPGHYLAVVAYDNVANQLIYRDPWPGRTGTDGFNLRMGIEEFKKNVKSFCIIFKD